MQVTHCLSSDIALKSTNRASQLLLATTLMFHSFLSIPILALLPLCLLSSMHCTFPTYLNLFHLISVTRSSNPYSICISAFVQLFILLHSTKDFSYYFPSHILTLFSSSFVNVWVSAPYVTGQIITQF